MKEIFRIIAILFCLSVSLCWAQDIRVWNIEKSANSLAQFMGCYSTQSITTI